MRRPRRRQYELNQRYSWMLSIMKTFELNYWNHCPDIGRDPNSYLRWLESARYKSRRPEHRKRLLVLLCPL